MTRKYELGDGPIEADLVWAMNEIARTADNMLNPGLKAPNKSIGFVMMVFPYGDAQGRCNYISNGANRDDVVTLMKEMIGRFENDT